jgi:hypothetical protein
MIVLVLSVLVVVLVVALGVLAWAGVVQASTTTGNPTTVGFYDGHTWRYFENVPGRTIKITFGRFYFECFIGRWCL